MQNIISKLKSGNGEKAPCIAVFGTGSDVGKSVIATALCRLFLREGLKVAPFKAQNMSNNSGITPEGLEMGRAQIVQAEAAGIVPHVDMNPILLKPTGETGAQVVVLGEVLEDNTAAEYHFKKERLFVKAASALDRLRMENDIVIMEGAGSCAEVNLMPYDIVNFRMAEYADAQVVIVADIHRGGVFGQLVGTMACLPEKYKKLVSGFMINRFRGDISLFSEGSEWIEAKTGKRVFGVLPWYSHITIEAEDSVVIEKPRPVKEIDPERASIAVLRIPHISNFTDFDPLKALEGVDLFFIEEPCDLSGFSAVILPGSKNTRHDLAWLKTSGWADILKAYTSNGGSLTGICGGYQMLGNYLHDPEGLEGPAGSTEGLGLLPVETVMKSPKTTTLSNFTWAGAEGTGYEIHMGHTKRCGGEPLFHVQRRNSDSCEDEDGCLSPELNVVGTYMHGLFDQPAIIRRWLGHMGIDGIEVSDIQGLCARNKDYELLADHFEAHIDMTNLCRLTLS